MTSDRAMLIDFLSKMKRGPQVITQKDIGLILAYTGLSSGWKIVEAGSGSGGLTLFLANSVKPSGKIYSYDNRREHLEIARYNIKEAGLEKFVDFKNKDVSKGIPEKNVDMVVLDLAEPWLVSKHAKKSLKSGGFFVCYVPTTEQVKQAAESMKMEGFENIEIMESIVRKWKSEEKSTRPENMGLMHTGFVIIARKF